MFDEPNEVAWEQRFGKRRDDLPDLHNFLNHRSVRHFSGDPISREVMSGLIGAAQSASTSSNLQLWSVVSIQDPAHRETVAKLCADQNQIRNAAWFLAFLADTHRLKQVAASVGEEAGGLDFAEFYTMACIDAALAAERMVCAAEALEMGVCYIGALRNDPEGVRDALALPSGVFGVFGLCLGWPATDANAAIKPRLAQNSIWFEETYPAELDLADYNQRMADFYVSQGMNSQVDWSMRSARRVDGNHMTGRGGQLAFLHEQGLILR